MVFKLFKYDFKANSRKIMPLLAVFLIISLLIGISEVTSAIRSSTMQAFLGIIYAIVLVSIFIIYFSNIIRHYRESMYGNEGYLMHTLPMNSKQLLLSKLLSAFCVELICLVAGVFSILLITHNFSGIFDFMPNMISYFGEVVQLILILIASNLMSLNLIFLCGSISSIPAIKYRNIGTLVGVVSFFVITYCIGLITRWISIPFANLYLSVNTYINLSIIYILIIGAIEFFATTYLIDHYKAL